MINKTPLFLLALSALFFLPACKQRKAIQKIKAEEKPIVIPTSFSLPDSIETHSFKFRTLSSKIKTDVIFTDGSEVSLMITMRAVSDSAIWMSASPALGIEAARVLFTKDSIKIMDKYHGEYDIESYSYLKRFTQADVTFEMLQNILTGNLAFNSPDFVTDSITNYYSAHCWQTELFQELLINKAFRIFDNRIIDKLTLDTITINYGAFELVENRSLPTEVKVNARSKGKNIAIMMNYSNVIVNMPVEIKFNIPGHYTKMKY